MPKKVVIKEPKKKRAKKHTRLRGMKDVMFEEHKYWDLVRNTADNFASTYGFKSIQTPVLERLDLYERSTGKDTDIVSKEMYSFVDKGGDKVALRPEGTPGIVRSYIEQGMFNLPQPVKTFWFGPVFRHEKPQLGRLRQHTQFNLDIFGEEGSVADAQLILISYNFYKELGVDVKVHINSIGCIDCRAAYIKTLVEFYKERGKRSKMCADCKKRFLKNPLRLLDCKNEGCVEISEGAPQIVDFLCDPCKDHFIKVLEYLDDMDVPYNLTPFLVRGLDYYNRTVFELVTTNFGTTLKNVEEGEGLVENEGSAVETVEVEQEEISSGKQISLGGGGRYDDMVEMLGGRPTPACGFGLGVERIIQKMKENDIVVPDVNENCIFLAQLGDQARRRAFMLFEEMRKDGYKMRQAFTKDSLKAQLEEADRLNARYCLIIGQKELLDETVIIKDMEAGTQEVIDNKKIRHEIDRRMKLDAEEKKTVKG